MQVALLFGLYAAIVGGLYRELAAWLTAMALFACFYAWHITQAATLYWLDDLVSAGWLGLGRWNFAIATAKWNVLLHMLPPPLIALAICLGIVGLAGFHDGRDPRSRHARPRKCACGDALNEPPRLRQ